jgi:hypothetical protein
LSTVDLAKLQSAFTNIYATMDEIDTFKVAALDSMQKTVTALSSEIAKSQSYLDRVRRRRGTRSRDRQPGVGAGVIRRGSWPPGPQTAGPAVRVAAGGC